MVVEEAAPRRARRRQLLAQVATVVVGGCAAPLKPFSRPESAAAARDLLAGSAAAHGLEPFSALHDLSLAYAGSWPPFVDRLQPELVDAGFKGGSEERLLLREGMVAQAHVGPEGRKQVVRRTEAHGPGTVRVWADGTEIQDATRRAAAALVVDGYSLFLLGPLLLAGRWATDRTLDLELASDRTILLDRREVACAILRVRMAPGLGFAPSDELAFFVDRDDGLVRRVRFSLEGLESTRGAIAEVDMHDHVTRHGVRWPTRFRERLLRPLPLRVHDWRLTGLDVDRGLVAEEIEGMTFSGAAVTPAHVLPAPGESR